MRVTPESPSIVFRIGKGGRSPLNRSTRHEPSNLALATHLRYPSAPGPNQSR
jgi:hypothetical protein